LAVRPRCGSLAENGDAAARDAASDEEEQLATVLYVDDERAIARALKSWLTRRGHVVYTAASLEEAKKVLDTSQVDGAFIDIWLGSESGFDLFEWLDMNQPRVAANVVFVTGDIVPDRPVQQALDAYARPVLVKPFELSELEGIVRGWEAK
jgi:DNA-binding response OmpR family regulator